MKTRILRNKWSIALFLCVAMMITLSVLYISADSYFSGSEVITYGMANNPKAGWMLSRGRAVEYFSNEIAGDSLGETLNNLKEFAADILQNRRQAAYFSYPRPAETGWYTQEETDDWFTIREDERFQYGDVYLSAMGDDANSFLYYSLVHTVSSLFPDISDTKWSAFIVNELFFVLAFIVLFRLGKTLFHSRWKGLLICFIWGISGAFATIVTRLRPYMLATFFQVLLVYLHVLLMLAMRNGNKKRFKHLILLLIPVYAAGYVSHYTTGFLAVFLAVYTLVTAALLRKKKHAAKGYAVRYTCAGLGAVLLGLCLDPVSVPGLLSKLSMTSSKADTALSSTWLSLNTNLFGNVVFAVCFAIVLVINFIHWVRHREERDVNRILIWGLTVTMLCYCFALVYATKEPYFRAVFPVLILLMAAHFMQILQRIFSRIANGITGRRLYAALGAALILLYGVFGGYHVYLAKQTESANFRAVVSAFDFEEADTLILLREHAGISGYGYFPLLREFEHVLVITEPNSDMEVYLQNALLAEEDEVLVFSVNGNEPSLEFQAAALQVFPESRFTIISQGNHTVLLRWKLFNQ